MDRRAWRQNEERWRRIYGRPIGGTRAQRPDTVAEYQRRKAERERARRRRSR